MESIIDRRVFFKVAATGVAGCFVSPMRLFAQTIASDSQARILGKAKYCIYILLPGAPSQIDTFDLRVCAWSPHNFVLTTVHELNCIMAYLSALTRTFNTY